MADSNTTRNTTYNGLSQAIIIYNALGLIGCLLNGFVCIIIGTRRSLRQPFNHLILNLSVSNFVLSFAIILYGLSNYLAANLSLSSSSMSLADVACKLDVFCFLSGLTATCFTLFIISIERYQAVAIVRIHKIELSLTRKVIVIVWILASLSAIIPAGFAEIDKDLFHSCYIGRIQNIILVILCMILFVLSSILPAILMLATYSIIIYKLYVNIQVSPSGLSPAACRRKKSLRRSIIAIIFISILSTGSCLPHLILHIIVIMGDHYQENFKSTFLLQNKLVWNFFSISFMLTPAITPLLYNLASSQFRDALHRIFCSHCHCLRSNVFKAVPEPVKQIGTLKSQSTKVSQQLPTIN